MNIPYKPRIDPYGGQPYIGQIKAFKTIDGRGLLGEVIAAWRTRIYRKYGSEIVTETLVHYLSEDRKTEAWYVVDSDDIGRPFYPDANDAALFDQVIAAFVEWWSK